MLQSKKQKLTVGFVLIGLSVLLFIFIFYSIFKSAQS